MYYSQIIRSVLNHQDDLLIGLQTSLVKSEKQSKKTTQYIKVQNWRYIVLDKMKNM